MKKVKCSKCGYLNPEDELVCGMCGEVFKKEKAGFGGKKIVEEVQFEEVEEPKPKKTRRKKADSFVEPEPIKLPKSDPLSPPVSSAPAAPLPDVKSAIRNFLQTEEFRQSVKLIAREVAPEGKDAPPPMSPEDLKSIVENKIDTALPNLLQSEAVLALVRETVSEMQIPEGSAPAAPALSDEELETRIGEVLAKSAGRKGGPSLTMEAVELKVNAMLADIREKIAPLPDAEALATLEEVSKVVENQVKSALEGSSPGQAPEELEKSIIDKVKQFLEEQGTKELPMPAMDEDKIQSIIDSRFAEITPAPGAAEGAVDPAAMKKMIEQSLDEKFNSTEFALLMMDIARDAVGQSGSGGDGETGATISDEVLSERIRKTLPKLVRGDEFRGMIASAIEDTVAIPQLSARDVERVVNTRFEILENDLMESESFNKKITRSIEAGSVGQQASPEDIEGIIARKLEELRSETAGLVENAIKEHLGSGDFEQKIRELAGEEASKAAPEIPEFDTSEIEAKIDAIREEAISASADSGEDLKLQLDGVPALIEQKLDEFRQEMLGSDEIASKISDIARQIAEGTMQASPSLTKDDISAAWDEKFFSNEVEEKIKELAGEMATRAVLEIPEPDSSEVEAKILAVGMDLQSKLDSQEYENKIRALAAEEAAKAAPEIPEFDTAEIEAKIDAIREEAISASADSGEDLKLQLDGVPALIEQKLDEFRQEMLGSDEIASKISDIARQIAEGTMEARPSLTKDDISAAWDEKFSSGEAEDKIKELASLIVAENAPEMPEFDTTEIEEKISNLRGELQSATADSLEHLEDELTGMPELIEQKLDEFQKEMLGSDEIASKISDIARQIAEGTMDARPSLSKEDISAAWDEKFSSGEVEEKIKELAGEMATRAVLEIPEPDTSDIEAKILAVGMDLQSRLDSQEYENKIRALAAEEAAKVAPEEPTVSPAQMQEQISEAVSNAEKKLLESDELTAAIQEAVGPMLDKNHELLQPLIMEKVSNLVTESINAAFSAKLGEDEFGARVRELADESALETLASQPRLTPDDVREISGGQFDHWIETYFKSEDFKDKVTEHIRSVAMEMLRDARNVILEDAEMRTGEQIEARLESLETVKPDDLSEKLESLKTYFNNKLNEQEDKLGATAEEKVAARMGEINTKLEEALSESDDKLREVAMAFEQDIRPFKEKIETINESVAKDIEPINEKLKEIDSKVEKDIPAFKKELAQFVGNAAESAASMKDKLENLEKDVKSGMESVESRLDKLATDMESGPSPEDTQEIITAGLEAARGEIESKVDESLTSMEEKIKTIEVKIASVPKADPATIQKIIIEKVGDLPRQVEVFQKRLAGLAEESLSRGGGKGGGGVSKDEINSLVDARIAEVDIGALGPEEIAALVMTQLEIQMGSLYQSEEFKNAIVQHASFGGGDSGINKEEFEQALRAFVKLEIGRAAGAVKTEMMQFLESDEFAGKLQGLVPAGGGGGGGAPIDQDGIMEMVKKALDTKEVNLKIAQKFLEVMSYVKSEVPKLVQAAVNKQT